MAPAKGKKRITDTSRQVESGARKSDRRAQKGPINAGQEEEGKKSPKIKGIKTKCFPSVAQHFFEKMKSKLEGDENGLKLLKAKLNNTPFGQLFDFPLLMLEQGLLDTILELWDNQKNGVKLAGKFISFTANVVALILRIKNYGRPVVLTKSKNEEESPDFFEGCTYVKRDEIETEFENLVEKIMKSKQDYFKMKRLFVLYLFYTLLFPNRGQTVPRRLIQNAYELKELENYNWAEAIHACILDEVSAASEKVKGRVGGEISTVDYIGSCVIACILWLYEHTSISTPQFPVLSPRILK